MKVSSFFQSRWRLLVTGLFGLGTMATAFWWYAQSYKNPPQTAALPLTNATKSSQNPTVPPKDHRDPEVDGEPGFYKQWYDMRKDEHGRISTGLRQL